MYDHSQRYKWCHEHRPVDSRHRKMMGHVLQPGSADRLLGVTPLSCDRPRSQEYSWRAYRGRSAVRSAVGFLSRPVSQKPRFSREAVQRLSARSRFGERTSGLNRDRILRPIRACQCACRSIAHSNEFWLRLCGTLPSNTWETRSASPISRAFCLPRYCVTLVRLITLRSAIFASLVKMSSCTPSAKKACSFSSLRFSNGNTAMPVVTGWRTIRFSKRSRLMALPVRATLLP